MSKLSHNFRNRNSKPCIQRWDFGLGAIDWTIILIYFIFVLGIGWALKKYMKDSTACLEAGSADANPMGVGWFGVLMGL